MSDNDVKIIAHRGYHWEGAEENSLEAIQLSNDVADGAEFDVRLTADGIMVLSHDPVTVYGTDISTSRFVDLKDEFESTGGHLTTFHEALHAIQPGKMIFAEVKVALAATRILAEVPRDRLDCLRIGSFWPAQTEMIPARHRWLNALKASDVPADISGFDCLVARADAFPLGLLPPKDLGAWGINSAAQAERLIKLGVRYLIVDDPKSMAHLRGRNIGYDKVATLLGAR